MPPRTQVRFAVTATVTNFAGVHTHSVDLRSCRRAWALRQAEGVGLDRMGDLAHASDTSLSSVSRFWHGGPVRVTIARRIVEALGLRFEQVASPVDAAA